MRSSATATRTRLISLGATGLAVGVLLTLAAGTGVALLFAPALALALLLAHGIAPGSAFIERWRGRRAAMPRRPSPVFQRRLTLVIRRVGHLLAAALAMRPPPVAAVVPSHR